MPTCASGFTRSATCRVHMTQLGTEQFASRVLAETQHYRKELGRQARDGLARTPNTWSEVERVMAEKIQAATGHQDGVECVIAALDRCTEPRFLSLGAGSCALELTWIVPRLRRPSRCTLECVDVNQDLIDQGAKRARKMGVPFRGAAQDVNELRLEPESYDVILCWASLHHFVALDHIAGEINRALKPGGCFITMDICSRNGFRLWPETESVVEDFFRMLPKSHRIAHTLAKGPVTCDHYPNVDCAQSGLEWIRSEEILPALERNLGREVLIFAHTLLRRFFDTMFGPNFDLERPFDRSFFRLVRDYDEQALALRLLRPDTFFGIYRRRALAADVAPGLAEIFGELD